MDRERPATRRAAVRVTSRFDAFRESSARPPSVRSDADTCAASGRGNFSRERPRAAGTIPAMEAKYEEFQRLRDIVAELRGPEGCPWDRAQTLRDIARHLIEEAAEVADAVSEAGGAGSPHVCEELGDVLTNVLLASRIAEESGAFSVDDVARVVREKLVRRHPHVFGEPEVVRENRASNAGEALQRWERAKSEETKDAEAVRSRLAGIPRSLPPLARAYKVSARAARHGFDWPEIAGSLEKLEEEVREVRDLLESSGLLDSPGAREPGETAEDDRVRGELGDVLFATVNLCRKLGVHPDEALRATLRKFTERFEHIESRIPDLDNATLEEMDRVWDEMRAREARRGAIRGEERSP